MAEDQRMYFQDGTLAYSFVDYPTITESTGSLTVVENFELCGFQSNRVFFVHDVSPEANRGFHYHQELKQLLFCIQGSVDITLDTGIDRQSFNIQANGSGIFVDGKVWREMRGFKGDCILAVLCDKSYKEDIVKYNYEEFLREVK